MRERGLHRSSGKNPSQVVSWVEGMSPVIFLRRTRGMFLRREKGFFE
jgi:hypothetical protein